MSDYGQTKQAETRDVAIRNGEGWTCAEIVAACASNVGVAALALALGRTYYAVASARAASANGRALGGGTKRDVLPRDGRAGREYVGWGERDGDGDANVALLATYAAPKRVL